MRSASRPLPAIEGARRCGRFTDPKRDSGSENFARADVPPELAAHMGFSAIHETGAGRAPVPIPTRIPELPPGAVVEKTGEKAGPDGRDGPS